MSYTITITENKTVVEMKKGEWVKVFSDEQLKGTNTRAFDYAPDREEPVTHNRIVLTQTVDELNVAAVIKAVNNL